MGDIQSREEEISEVQRGAILRAAESIQLIFVTMFLVSAWLCPLSLGQRLRVTGLASVAIVAITMARYSAGWLTPRASSVLRDWFPAALLLVPYWQVGEFFTSTDSAVEQRLAAFDRRCFALLGTEPLCVTVSPVLTTYLQFAYMMVYPLIPLGLVALYLGGLRSRVDDYWIVVLAATYVCFATTIFVRARPPRLSPGYSSYRIPSTSLGILNENILSRASIQAITFPSAHVASAMAAALILLKLEPRVGLVFLWMALSVAVATIVGGYHYVADVVVAIGVATLVFGVASCIR